MCQCVSEHVFKSRLHILKFDCIEKRLDQSTSSRYLEISLPITRYFCLDTLHPRDPRVDRFHNDPI